MSAVDSVDSLVVAAAQAAGPCPPGEEAAWGRRVQALVVDLHLIAQQARQDIARLESAATFAALIEKVEIEESSRRGLVTLRLPSGESEQIRTEQEGTDRGRALIERARSLTGHWALVYRYNERKSGQRAQSVRMLAHLLDLGGERRGARHHGQEDRARGRGRRRGQGATGLAVGGPAPVRHGERRRARAGPHGGASRRRRLITARSEWLPPQAASVSIGDNSKKPGACLKPASSLRASVRSGSYQIGSARIRIVPTRTIESCT